VPEAVAEVAVLEAEAEAQAQAQAREVPQVAAQVLECRRCLWWWCGRRRWPCLWLWRKCRPRATMFCAAAALPSVSGPRRNRSAAPDRIRLKSKVCAHGQRCRGGAATR
jgi:hypothetical protein